MSSQPNPVYDQMGHPVDEAMAQLVTHFYLEYLLLLFQPATATVVGL